MSIGCVLSLASATSRRAVSAAVESVMVPNRNTVRERNAFSSRKELRGSTRPGVAGAAGCSGGVSRKGRIMVGGALGSKESSILRLHVRPCSPIRAPATARRAPGAVSHPRNP
jgi:hypothetical protein